MKQRSNRFPMKTAPPSIDTPRTTTPTQHRYKKHINTETLKSEQHPFRMSSTNTTRPRSSSHGGSTSTTSNNDTTGNKNDAIGRPGAYAVTQTTPGPAQVLRVQVPTGVRPGSEFVVHPQNPRRTVRVRCPITSGPGKTLQITIPPEPITSQTYLKAARLTAPAGSKKGGGARTMLEEIVKSNEKRMEKYYELQQQQAQQLRRNSQMGSSGSNTTGNNNPSLQEELSKIEEQLSHETNSSHHSEGSSVGEGGGATTTTPSNNGNHRNRANSSSSSTLASNNNTASKQPKAFLVTIPPNIHPGMPFTIEVQGKRYVINCPATAGPGKKVKIVPPQAPPAPKHGNSTSGDASVHSGTSRSRSNSQTEAQHSNTNSIRRKRADTTDSFSEQYDEHSEGDSSSNNNNQQQQQLPSLPPTTKMQMFEVRVPAGVEPGQPFALSANGQRVLVTCPPNVQVGQKIRFNLPVTQQMVQKIQLQYNEGDSKKSASGWCRTIRVSDLKFQWVRVTKQGNNNNNNNNNNDKDGTTTTTSSAEWIDQSRRLLDVNAMNDFHFSKSAYGRHLTLLKGNDARLRTGILSWVPAKDATVDSKLVLHQKVLLSYADIATIQQKPFADKLVWFEQSLSKLLLIPWEDGHVKMFLRRTHLLQDSVDAVMSLSRTQLRQRWRLEFANEPAVDAGGVTREWFQLITQQLFDANFGLWMPSANNQACCTINPVSGTY